MKKNIVVVSNPFGYGPSSHALSIIRSLRSRLKTQDVSISFAGSTFCYEICALKDVRFLKVDERNEAELMDLFKNLENLYIISSQNRFAVKVSNQLGIPNAFLDILAWFWKEIPRDHLLSDNIFWIKFPRIEDKIPKGYFINLISGIVENPVLTREKKNQVIVHIGGAKYPLMDGLPYNYLLLLSHLLDSLKIYGDLKIIVAGGKESIDFMRGKINNPSVFLNTFKKDDLMKELSVSKHMITTAGMSSTLESFVEKIPTSFLFPLNLSHVGLSDLLGKYNACPQLMIWDDYLDLDEDIRGLNEKEALMLISNYAAMILSDPAKFSRVKEDFNSIINHVPEISGQREFIQEIGTTGSDEMADVLIKKWNM